MKRFDCLSQNMPLFGPHLLEASAGTGKTFSIEHIYVRFILESIDVEEILAVTFTRAATRELKARIRGNIEKAIYCIRENIAEWEYLKPHLGNKESLRLLTDAAARFDQCQIFTIHGFCYRSLKEFAFEAKVGSIQNPDEGRLIPKVLTEAVLDFLENGIDSEMLCLEQLSLLTKEFDSMEQLGKKLLRMEAPKEAQPFKELFLQCKAALHHWSGGRIEEDKLLLDFEAIEGNYKKVKGDLRGQVIALSRLEVPEAFAYLIKEKGSIFEFLAEENKKVRAKEVGFLYYAGFFEWAKNAIAPLLEYKVFPVLQAAWNPIGEKILKGADHLDPDEILVRMNHALGRKPFLEALKKKYKAAIIDEFQDTDAVQWEIFQSLFLNQPIEALYLVGDPKQSIYRFRKADVYTYLKARDRLGEEHLYHLDTNFRSSKGLIGALNALFNRDWLELPKVNRTLPFQPVQAGAAIESDFQDEKGAVHFFVAEGEHSALFEEVFLPLAAREIEALGLRKCAILVKDRYQVEKTLKFLQQRGIPAVAKRSEPLGETVAFQAICELFEATFSPRDASLAKIVMAGPFGRQDLCFVELKLLLEERGIVAFSKQFKLDQESLEVFELLFQHVQIHGFSMEGIRRALREIKDLSVDEGGSRRMLVKSDAVEIMTIHISKGLEFDVVFALGLSSRTPASEEVEELDAEKKRQLYVAMTRAKKRLYVPFALSKRAASLGTHSPIELFKDHFDGSMLEGLEAIQEKESITLERIGEPVSLGPPIRRVESSEEFPRKRKVPIPFKPSFLSSFTTLAKTVNHPGRWKDSEDTKEYDLQSMPRGTETGIFIHALFEHIFNAKRALWRDSDAIDRLVEDHLAFTALDPWKRAIQKMVKNTLSTPLFDGFSLQDLEFGMHQVEVEFVFSHKRNFIKGFIDLVFEYQNKIYFLDWKTNWLESYEAPSVEKAMIEHDYFLQASIYAEALRRHFQMEIGSAFYLFLRGGAVQTIDVEKLSNFN